MAERVVRLHPAKGFFLSHGLHLVNPEKPVHIFPEGVEIPEGVKKAIKRGVLIDVNGNILTDEKKTEPAPEESKKEAEEQNREQEKELTPEEPKQEEEESQEEDKPKARGKAKGKR